MKIPLIFGICLLVAGCATKEETASAPVVDVKAARAELGDVRLSVSAPATIFPRQQANIAPRLTAPIRRLHFQKVPLHEIERRCGRSEILQLWSLRQTVRTYQQESEQLSQPYRWTENLWGFHVSLLEIDDAETELTLDERLQERPDSPFESINENKPPSETGNSQAIDRPELGQLIDLNPLEIINPSIG